MNEECTLAQNNIPSAAELKAQLQTDRQPEGSQAAKVISAMTQQLILGATKNIREHVMCLAAYELTSSEMSQVVKAFKNKGYTTNLLIERSPYGKRELSVSW